MQSWPLERKIQVSQTRILEFGLKYPDKTYISFSGGKDSTVLMDLVRRVFPDTPAVFIDTGLEYPEVRKFAMSQPDVVVVKPELTFRQVIEKYGYPLTTKRIAGYVNTAKRNPNSTRAQYLRGEKFSTLFGFGDGKFNFLTEAPFEISDYCCNVMKKQPAHRYTKKTGQHPILGTMACESIHRRNEWKRSGCNIIDGHEPMCKPMSFWTEQDVLQYILKYLQGPLDLLWQQAGYARGSVRKRARKELRRRNYSQYAYAPVYGKIVQDENGRLHTTGCVRTGCVFCAFGCHLEGEPGRFQLLKKSHPKLYNYCMRPWDQGGLGLKDVFDWFNEHVPKGKKKTPHIYYE